MSKTGVIEVGGMAAQARALLVPMVEADDRSIAALAQAIGVHRPDLSAWLRGRRSMRIDAIEALARLLGVELVVIARDV